MPAMPIHMCEQIMRDFAASHGGYDEALRTRESYVEIARTLGEHVLAQAQESVATLRSTYDEYKIQFDVAEKAVRELRNALAAMISAREVDAAGTRDPKEALTRRDLVIVTEASARIIEREVPGAIGSLSGTRVRVVNAISNSPVLAAVKESELLADLVISRQIEFARDKARDQATSTSAAYWLLAQAIVLGSTAARFAAIAEADERSCDLPGRVGVRNAALEPPVTPTQDDLKKVFSERSQARARKIQDVKNQIVALQGELS
jgi:hypothetical protein